MDVICSTITDLASNAKDVISSGSVSDAHEVVEQFIGHIIKELNKAGVNTVIDENPAYAEFHKSIMQDVRNYRTKEKAKNAVSEILDKSKMFVVENISKRDFCQDITVKVDYIDGKGSLTMKDDLENLMNYTSKSGYSFADKISKDGFGNYYALDDNKELNRINQIYIDIPPATPELEGAYGQHRISGKKEIKEFLSLCERLGDINKASILKCQYEDLNVPDEDRPCNNMTFQDFVYGKLGPHFIQLKGIDVPYVSKENFSILNNVNMDTLNVYPLSDLPTKKEIDTGNPVYRWRIKISTDIPCKGMNFLDILKQKSFSEFIITDNKNEDKLVKGFYISGKVNGQVHRAYIQGTDNIHEFLRACEYLEDPKEAAAYLLLREDIDCPKDERLVNGTMEFIVERDKFENLPVMFPHISSKYTERYLGEPKNDIEKSYEVKLPVIPKKSLKKDKGMDI